MTMKSVYDFLCSGDLGDVDCDFHINTHVTAWIGDKGGLLVVTPLENRMCLGVWIQNGVVSSKTIRIRRDLLNLLT